MQFSRSFAWLAIPVLGLVLGCGQKKAAVVRAPLELLDAALSPDHLAMALQKAGGGHFHATTTIRVDGGPAPKDGSKPASPSSITTTSDLWIDKQGNFRLVENNDLDNGREIVGVGNELAVALRYSKMIRRATQDSEKQRLLAETVGGPFMAWEIVRRQVEVEGTTESGFRLKQGNRRLAPPPGSSPTAGLRAWRESAEAKSIEGQVKLDPTSQTLRSFECKTSFKAMRDDLPVDGAIAVTAVVAEVGKTAGIIMPSADTLPVRQRSILEEKALLGGGK
jgi:hypothetical protein